MLRRRHFLSLAGTLLQTVLILPWRVRPARSAVGESALADLCADVFADPESAAAIGCRYLQLVPSEGRIEVLAANLTASLGRYASRSGQRRWTKADLSSAIQRDFERGDIVLIDAWVLARVEARICAFIELLCHRDDPESAV